MSRWLAWGVAIACAGVVAVCFAPTPLRDRLYREVSYQYVANQVTAGAANETERILRIFDFVHQEVNVAGAEVVDDSPWNDLIRGIGWCDQQSWDFATLLSKQNIHARFAMLRKASGVSPHTVAEVKIGDRWALFDPLNGLYYRKPDGTFATLEEVVGDQALIIGEPKIQSLEPEVRAAFLDSVPNFYPLEQEPTRWTSLLLKKNRSRAQRITNQAIRVSVTALGTPLAYAYQDLYYLTAWPRPSTADALYRRARNYQLYGRLNAAERGYRQVLAKFPSDDRADDAQFQLARVLTAARRFQESLDQLAALSHRDPPSKWSALLPDLVGRNREAMGDLAGALTSYELVAGNLDVDGPWRVGQLRAR